MAGSIPARSGYSSPSTEWSSGASISLVDIDDSGSYGWATDEEISFGSDVSAEYRTEFDIELFAPSRFSLDLPKLNCIVGGSRWVLVQSETGHDYGVFMKKDGGCYMFQRGWNLVCSSENLAAGQNARFEWVGNDVFRMWNDDYGRPLGPIGFSAARTAPIQPWNEGDYIVGQGAVLTPPVVGAMQTIWEASSESSKMYVCVLLPSQLERRAMFFSKEYSTFLPHTKRTVALRMVGSKLVIPGSIIRDSCGISRISAGWSLYAEHHNLCVDEVLVFRIHRGPSAWEMLACRSGVMIVQ